MGAKAKYADPGSRKSIGWLIAGFLPVGLALLGGCTVRETVYLKSLEVEAPLSVPPVPITDSTQGGEFRASMRLSRLFVEEVHGTVPTGGPPMPGASSGSERDNLVWQLQKMYGALDLQYTVSRHVALTGGMSYGSVQGRGYWGGNAGLGFFSETKGLAWRLDAGVNIQSTSFLAPSVVVTDITSWTGGTSTNVHYFTDYGDKTQWAPYALFTFNSSHQDWLLNFFLQGSVWGQTLASFHPENETIGVPPVTVYEQVDTRATYTATMFSFAGGLYMRLGEEYRILGGVRWVGGDIADQNPSSLWMPVLQFDALIR
jgi:hypothetical protein